MRALPWFVLLGLAACGDNRRLAVVDAGVPSDPDAAELRDVPDGAVQRCAAVRGTTIAFEPVAALTASGDEEPVLVTSPPGDPRLFVVMRGGRVRIIKNGVVLAEPFVDLRSRRDDDGLVQLGGSERGLLGLAFHPDYAHNRRFFVYYTAGPGDAGKDVLAEMRVSLDDPDRADPASRKVALAIDDFAVNHNGGMPEFGPDGMLWLGTGDGGGGGDPKRNGQRDSSLLAKMLRLDMTHIPPGAPYGIPADNPFASSRNGADDPRPEVWAKGLRNPWRYSFDPATGDLYIGDVGQDAMEEIDVAPSTTPGLNYGWSRYEGTIPAGGKRAGLTFPAVVHTQPSSAIPDDDDGDWHAIVGGVVYRGSCFPDLQGWYYYSDYVDSRLWRFRWDGAKAVDDAPVAAIDFPRNPTSIHTDAFGEVYVTAADGRVMRMVARP